VSVGRRLLLREAGETGGEALVAAVDEERAVLPDVVAVPVRRPGSTPSLKK
jgi:hypothetical protein